ncbi:hypothetical protein MKW98_004365 [Papaver atlanticum]|uniref:Uncharacterized protein n=1 Tax=Papaver atlanticum TaxID=357466 RepID=A0AAD4SPS0_9MAGN|nr:hypothetical protein MKW98_004365 [Papaver atlanticum]
MGLYTQSTFILCESNPIWNASSDVVQKKRIAMASYNVRGNPASQVLVMWLAEQTAVTLEAQVDCSYVGGAGVCRCFSLLYTFHAIHQAYDRLGSFVLS